MSSNYRHAAVEYVFITVHDLRQLKIDGFEIAAQEHYRRRK